MARICNQVSDVNAEPQRDQLFLHEILLASLGMRRPRLPVTAISFKCRGNKDIQWRKTHEIGVAKMRIAAHDIFSYG